MKKLIIYIKHVIFRIITIILFLLLPVYMCVTPLIALLSWIFIISYNKTYDFGDIIDFPKIIFKYISRFFGRTFEV